MKTLDYKTAYNKVIDAYFKDEIKILNCQFCFCGTLNNNDRLWVQNKENLPYSYTEFSEMEKALFSTFSEIEWINNGLTDTMGDFDEDDCKDLIENYEEKLFNGICAALDVLKQIHINRNDETALEDIQFTQRKLETV